MDKRFLSEGEAETRDIRPLDDTVEGEAVIPELDREEGFMLYMDPRVSNYYRNDHGRSAVNCPIDFRRMWRWLRDPTGPLPEQTDAGLAPCFGGDLIAR